MTPRRSSTEKQKSENVSQKNFMILVLLLQLKGWNAHGYELMQKLMQFGFQSLDQGNFYRILRQLEKDKLVTSEWDTTTSGPAKRIYSITAAGEDYLNIWADSLEQYQKMLNQFFNMYSNFFTPPGLGAKKEDKKEDE